MMFRYLAIDMDGTLLDDKKQISQANVDAIKRLQAQSVEFIIVSGRHYHEITGVLEPYGITNIAYVIYRDGQYISKQGKVIHEGSLLTMNDVRRMLSISGAKNLFCSTKDNDYTIYRSFIRYIIVRKSLRQDAKMIYLPLILAKWRSIRVGKAIFFNGELNDRAKYDEMRKCFTVHFVNGREYDVFPSNVNKFAALQWLSEHEGVDLSKLVYMGDDYNDIECFENLPHCVVMGNAPEDLKQYSMMKDVKTNNDNGVVDALQKLFY